MKIGVVGAGGVGAYFAAVLAAKALMGPDTRSAVPIHDAIYRALQLRDGATPPAPC